MSAINPSMLLVRLTTEHDRLLKELKDYDKTKQMLQNQLNLLELQRDILCDLEEMISNLEIEILNTKELLK